VESVSVCDCERGNKKKHLMCITASSISSSFINRFLNNHVNFTAAANYYLLIVRLKHALPSSHSSVEYKLLPQCPSVRHSL